MTASVGVPSGIRGAMLHLPDEPVAAFRVARAMLPLQGEHAGEAIRFSMADATMKACSAATCLP